MHNDIQVTNLLLSGHRVKLADLGLSTQDSREGRQRDLLQLGDVLGELCLGRKMVEAEKKST